MYCLDLLENTTWISRLSAAAQTKGFGRLAEWVAGSGQPSRLRRNEKHEDALSNMMLNGKSRYRLWVGEAHSKTGPVQNPKPRHFKPFEFFCPHRKSVVAILPMSEYRMMN